MKIRRLIAIGAMLLLTPYARTQQLSETAQVTVIEVPVTVVDREGRAVRNLTKNDFELYDDGRPVTIEYFDALDVSTPADPASAAVSPVMNRHFLLLFDIAHSSPGTIARASEAARQFVHSQLRERDLAAVAVFTAESGAKIITAFTRDRALLERAIGTLGDARYFKLADPLMMSATSELTLESPVDSNDLAQRSRDEAAAETTAEFRVMNARGRDSELRNRLKIQTQNFGMLARTLDGIEGQKQVILLSEGFDARIVQGREELGFEKTREDTDNVFSGEVHKVDQEERFGSSAAAKDLADMIRLFRRSDVVLHAIDIKGLRANVDASSGAMRPSTESLSLMATPTGGTVFRNGNDIGNAFARMLKQQEVVYILGFTAHGNKQPERFHELKVKTKAGRVSHRAGYYEPGNASELQKTLGLAEILAADAPVKDLDLTLTAAALPGTEGRARVPVILEIPGPRLLDRVSGAHATVDLYLYAFDVQNQVVDFVQQRIALDLAKAGDDIRQAGLRYVGTLHLRPGDYAIKALIRANESGATGFVRSDLRVPLFDAAVALPPLFFEESSKWIMLLGPSRGDDYGWPFVVGDTKYVPRRNARLDPRGEYKLALPLHRVPTENLEVKPEIPGSPAPPVLTLLGRTAPDEHGTMKLLFRFAPRDLPAGEHELRFTIQAKDGYHAVVTIPFTVL